MQELKHIKNDQRERHARLEKDSIHLRAVLEKADAKERLADLALTKAEVERENLKNLHRLIDIDEDKRRLELEARAKF